MITICLLLLNSICIWHILYCHDFYTKFALWTQILDTDKAGFVLTIQPSIHSYEGLNTISIKE